MTTFVQDLFSVTGRIALVTGASSGIGRQMALTLARAGASVVLVARREDRLIEVFDEISRLGGSAEGVPADISDLDRLPDIYRQAAAAFGPPDILINAAGVNFRQPAEEVSQTTWQATMTLNLTVPFFLARECVPGMRDKGYGNLINIASLQSYRAFANGIAYGASKGGVTQLTRAMAEAWSRYGITANALAPGFFPTELTAPVFGDREMSAVHAGRTAIGRNGELADLDGATVFLSSRASAYITGQVLAVDGGYTAK